MKLTDTELREPEHPDCVIQAAFKRVKLARQELITKRRKSYTKHDCIAKEGSHYSKPYKDD